MLEIIFEEQYTLLDIQTSVANDELLKTIEIQVVEHMEQGNSNFIIHLKTMTQIPVEWAYTLEKLHLIVQKENGILIIASAPDALEQKLNALEVITTPTLDEAIDYVFMEEIEKNFWSDEED